jgi:hypothetical protein
MYILVDLWLGSASGTPDATTPTGKANSYIINYVRAWKLAGPGCGATGLEEEVNKNSISVYPNPSTTNFTLKISSEIIIKDAVIKIYDVCGKGIKNISINTNETIIDRGELQSGIYFYQIINNNERIDNGKLIIQ